MHYFQSVLQNSISLHFFSKQNKQKTPNLFCGQIVLGNSVVYISLTYLYAHLSINSPEKYFRKETRFYSMFKELTDHETLLLGNICLSTLEQGWEMLSY